MAEKISNVENEYRIGKVFTIFSIIVSYIIYIIIGAVVGYLIGGWHKGVLIGAITGFLVKTVIRIIYISFVSFISGKSVEQKRKDD